MNEKKVGKYRRVLEGLTYGQVTWRACFFDRTSTLIFVGFVALVSTALGFLITKGQVTSSHFATTVAFLFLFILSLWGFIFWTRAKKFFEEYFAETHKVSLLMILGWLDELIEGSKYEVEQGALRVLCRLVERQGGLSCSFPPAILNFSVSHGGVLEKWNPDDEGQVTWLIRVHQHQQLLWVLGFLRFDKFDLNGNPLLTFGTALHELVDKKRAKLTPGTILFPPQTAGETA